MHHHAVAVPILIAALSLANADDALLTDGVSEGAPIASGDAVRRFVPALFANGLEAAAAEMNFPNHKRDISLYINCAAKISDTGVLQEYFCLDYASGNDTKFRRVVGKFIETTSITPARVDGRPVAVEVYFRVFFGRQGDLYAVGVFPNWGEDAQKYGMEYQAPQRYDRDLPPRACRSEGGRSKVLVSADGGATGDVELLMSYGVPEHYSVCETSFSEAVSKGRYIPAQHEGKPVPATYVEMAGDPSWLKLKAPPGL